MNTVSGFLKYVVIRALLRDAGLICDSSDSDFGLYDVNGTSWCETYFGEFNITHNVNKQLPARSYQLLASHDGSKRGTSVRLSISTSPGQIRQSL